MTADFGVAADASFLQVEEQYARDVARVRGAGAIAPEDDYNAFLRVGRGFQQAKWQDGAVKLLLTAAMPVCCLL
jgi:hypothetical protein